MEPQLMTMGHLDVLAEEPLGKIKTRGRMSLLETMVVVVQALDPLAIAMGLPLLSMPLLASLGVVKRKRRRKIRLQIEESWDSSQDFSQDTKKKRNLSLSPILRVTRTDTECRVTMLPRTMRQWPMIPQPTKHPIPCTSRNATQYTRHNTQQITSTNALCPTRQSAPPSRKTFAQQLQKKNARPSTTRSATQGKKRCVRHTQAFSTTKFATQFQKRSATSTQRRSARFIKSSSAQSTSRHLAIPQ